MSSNVITRQARHKHIDIGRRRTILLTRVRPYSHGEMIFVYLNLSNFKLYTHAALRITYVENVQHSVM